MNSLRSKIFLMVAGILALVAFGVMLFSKQAVERSMLTVEQRSARNVLHLLELNIKGRWRTMLRDKVDAVQDVKRSIRQTAGMISAGLEPYRNMADNGELPQPKAQANALEWLANLETDEVYCFAFDETGAIIAHPDKAQLGASLADVQDIKGRALAQATRSDATRYGQAFAIFRQPHPESGHPVKQYANFFLIPEWGWVVGVAAFIEDVEVQIERKRQEITAVLRDNASRIRIAETGFVFLFNADGQVLLSPSETISSRLEAAVADGMPLLSRLKRSATSQEPILYELPSKDGVDPVAMESLVTSLAPLNLFVATAASRKEIASPARKLLQSQGVIIAGVLLLAMAVALGFSTRLSRPLSRLAAYAKVLPETDFTKPAEAPAPIADLPQSHRDEVGRLASSFIFMEASLRENIADLMRLTAARQRIESELAIARTIQMGLLPKGAPPLPKHPEVDLYAMLIPAKEVGGDLYSYFLLDDDRLCFSVGDVSDKGVPAALFMSMVQTLIRLAAEQGNAPEAIMQMVNEQLARDNPQAMFVTLLVAVLDMRSGVVAWANGGHNPPLLLHGRQVTPLTGSSGPVAGVIEGLVYTPLELTLAPGDALLFYTDGVTEAMDTQHNLYDEERLLRTVHDVAEQSPQTIVQRVWADVQQHATGAEQSDDVTMLCLRFNGRREA